MKLHLLPLLTAAAACLPAALAQQTYTYISIDYPNAPSNTYLTGINSQGDVVGSYSGDSKKGLPLGIGFVRSADGTFYTLEDASNPQQYFASGISDSGVIVGAYPTRKGQTGFIDVRGSFQNFTLPSGVTYLTGISTNNAIVGYSNNAGFERDVSGELVFLPYLNGFAVAPYGINSLGTMVGVNNSSVIGLRADGFILPSGGTYQTVDYPGAIYTALSGINDAGVAVGYSFTSAGLYSSFLYSQGQFTTIAYPGSNQTMAGGINASGVIVGTYYNADNSRHGFIATPVN